MTIHYGILSTSSIAPRFLAGVAEAGGAEVCAVSSRSAEKARDFAAAHGIPRAYGSHEALLADEAVDTVYISAVNGAHFRWARAALEAGKHVVCEKPLTTSADETRQLFALARRQGKFLMEAQKMLFLPAVEAVRDRIAAGAIGQVRQCEFRHSFAPTYNGWMFDPAAGGGTLLSSGVYAVTLLLWLFGPLGPAGGVYTDAGTGCEDQYMLAGATESGVLFTVANSTRAKLQDGARLYGDAGWIDLPDYWKARRAVIHRAGQPEETVDFPCEHELVYEARHIRRCLEQGLTESPVVPESLSAAAAAALERIRAAWTKAGR